MKDFPYSIPDSPQSKHYVQLLVSFSPSDCMYETYEKYGGNFFNSFPLHWYHNSTSFKIENYVKFDYEMVHSTNNTRTEDYWYSNVKCRVCGTKLYPCDEIYFKRSTDISIRRIQSEDGSCVQQITTYKVISMSKSDESLFDTIPKSWAYTCRDVTLGVQYEPQVLTIELHRSSTVQVWLNTPPHRIHGNDTVIIEWQTSNLSTCIDCATLQPERFIFNSTNFEKRQELVINRVKAGEVIFVPIFHGGGYDMVLPSGYPIYIE
ncbi:unnamed protein product [Rotaria sp. Silwood2]|nr:unnamed protein product [Rotaria sp. Silwood2]